MWDKLNQWDISLFLYLNNMGSPALDPFFMAVTNLAFVPLVGIILYFFFRYLSKKELLFSFLFIAIAILFSDQTCGNFIRDLNIRLRPCHMDELRGLFRSVREQMEGSCGGMYGFVSSHAGNAFALSVFASSVLHKKVKGIWWCTLFFAFFISYSRVYIGTHITGDVIVGGLIGAIYGAVFAFLYKKIMNRFSQQ